MTQDRMNMRNLTKGGETVQSEQIVWNPDALWYYMHNAVKTNWNPYVLRNNNPGGKTYYIIRRREPSAGLFAHYCSFHGHIRYALSNGMLPVIDLQHFPNMYLDPRMLGKVNAWEYYFCQPFGIGLDEAYNGQNVIMSSGEPISPRPGINGVMELFNNVNNELTEWRMIRKLGLLRIQPKIYESIMAEYNSIISKDDRVLGVILRGTDYVALKPNNHFIPPPIEVAIKTANDLRNQWSCNKIFLATEDYDIVARFKEFFKDVCVITKRQYVHYDGRQSIAFYHTNRENDFYLLGKEYLTQIVILSKCNCLLASLCGGTTGAILMSDGFENTVIFNLGRYGAQIAPPPVRDHDHSIVNKKLHRWCRRRRIFFAQTETSQGRIQHIFRRSLISE